MRVRASNGLGEFISISYLYLFIVWAIRLMSCFFVHRCGGLRRILLQEDADGC